jgi:HEAT repeat protein
VESLKDYDPDVRRAACECLSGLGAQGMPSLVRLERSPAYRRWFVAEFQEKIQAAIPSIVESLKDYDSDVGRTALECLSGLGSQCMPSFVRFLAY